MRSLLLSSLLLLLCATTTSRASSAPPSGDGLVITVASFNIWGGGDGVGSAVAATAHAIRSMQADVVGVQETRREGDPCDALSCPPAGASVAAELAGLLGWFFYEQTTTPANSAALWANAVLSRFPIVSGSATKHDLGVRLRLDNATELYFFNVHFSDYPYQPYQLMGIEYGEQRNISTAAEAVEQAGVARGRGLALLLADIKEAQSSSSGACAMVVTGDFNEPAYGDWNEAAVAAGHQPLVVHWPTTLAVESHGFIDAYRVVHPDVVKKPAYSWTTTTTAPPDKHDRIDQLLVLDVAAVEAAWIVGEPSAYSDLVVSPWPSDHRAVAARVRLGASCTPPATFGYVVGGAVVAVLLLSALVCVFWLRARRQRRSAGHVPLHDSEPELESDVEQPFPAARRR